jgi:hypothetical protein
MFESFRFCAATQTMSGANNANTPPKASSAGNVSGAGKSWATIAKATSPPQGAHSGAASVDGTT